MYICQCYSLTLSQLPHPHRVLKSVLYVCVFIPALPLGSSVPWKTLLIDSVSKYPKISVSLQLRNSKYVLAKTWDWKDRQTQELTNCKILLCHQFIHLWRTYILFNLPLHNRTCSVWPSLGKISHGLIRQGFSLHLFYKDPPFTQKMISWYLHNPVVPQAKVLLKSNRKFTFCINRFELLEWCYHLIPHELYLFIISKSVTSFNKTLLNAYCIGYVKSPLHHKIQKMISFKYLTLTIVHEFSKRPQWEFLGDTMAGP